MQGLIDRLFLYRALIRKKAEAVQDNSTLQLPGSASQPEAPAPAEGMPPAPPPESAPAQEPLDLRIKKAMRVYALETDPAKKQQLLEDVRSLYKEMYAQPKVSKIAHLKSLIRGE